MNIIGTFSAIFVAMLVGAVSAEPVIDDTPTRVQTGLKVDMKCVGTLKPKGIGDVSVSRWTLDCGGMDREHADWRAVREYIAPLGIARIRQQAGWARCEKDPGKYDFAWLDQVVFDAKKRGISVWMELSYGNPAYPGGGGRQLAAGFPKSPEALAAWDRWVEQMAKRYKGTVREWCIWNEPDLRNTTNSPAFAAEFAIRTAEILRREIPDAWIDAFALGSLQRTNFVVSLVKELEKSGKTDLFNAIAYHQYARNPDAPQGYVALEFSRKFAAVHVPGLVFKQGEGGTQSEWCGSGALSRIPWSEFSQAKYDLRRSLGDLGHGSDTEVFHICDLEYRTSGFHDGLVRYGLLKTSGQADGFRVLKVKMAYYAIQNAVSVFNDDFESLAERSSSTVEGFGVGAVYDWRHRETGIPLAVFWDATAIPTESVELRDVRIVMKGAPLAHPVWVDVITGNVYEIPADRVEVSAGAVTYCVPGYDSPAFVTDRSVLSTEESWEVRYRREHRERFAAEEAKFVPKVCGKVSPEDMRGPFPIVSTPYENDGSIDHKSLAKVVDWVIREGSPGVIWGQSNDSIDLLTDEEKFACFRTCAKAASGRPVVLALGANGTNAAHMLSIATEIERVAEEYPGTAIAMISRPPDDARSEQDIENAWDALGKTAKRPVIMQTYCSEKTPTPSVEMMVRLAKRHPGVFGYIKEEAAGNEANERMVAENGAKPAIKSVFSGWGGWQWLYQLRQCGSDGLITERVAYLPLIVRMWREYLAGGRRNRIAQTYAMYRMMIDQRNFPKGGLRDYSLYFLQKHGIFKNRVTRRYDDAVETEGGSFGSSRAWKLDTVEIPDRQRKELDALFDDMDLFLRQ